VAARRRRCAQRRTALYARHPAVLRSLPSRRYLRACCAACAPAPSFRGQVVRSSRAGRDLRGVARAGAPGMRGGRVWRRTARAGASRILRIHAPLRCRACWRCSLRTYIMPFYAARPTATCLLFCGFCAYTGGGRHGGAGISVRRRCAHYARRLWRCSRRIPVRALLRCHFIALPATTGVIISPLLYVTRATSATTTAIVSLVPDGRYSSTCWRRRLLAISPDVAAALAFSPGCSCHYSADVYSGAGGL